MLLDGVAHPVDLRVAPDGLVVGVDHDALEVLEGGVLPDPVGVQDAESLQLAANPLLGDGLKVPLGLHLLDGTRALGFTIGTTLGNGSFAATTTHADAVDDVALLGLVSQPSGPVGTGRTGTTMDAVQLAVLPAPDPEKVSHDIALLLAVELGHILVPF